MTNQEQIETSQMNYAPIVTKIKHANSPIELFDALHEGNLFFSIKGLNGYLHFTMRPYGNKKEWRKSINFEDATERRFVDFLKEQLLEGIASIQNKENSES